MIVCHCAVVNDRAVVAAVDQGARTLAGICRTTGAGSGCGACIFSLKRLLCEHGNPIAPPVQEVAGAAS
ncbi:(2Fe-2S)-binding protein [Nocardioides donggukensis]|uniref:Bacterioferritin-associated ferredoxin n=1 Tax=Nocardioides donggukensis TaxID=2774019 RepID=A0A927Q3T9_9ACTN|nr:(2Fe-2S)-binding protein [Nocardioides donggukensis]MBD8870901.1 (2Fe-2S)-binding protein [Nocardioides donggukensis]